MGCIGSAWAWLGSNSGQIQIVIAVIALFFAFLGYRKVIKQIEISNDQTKISLDNQALTNKQNQTDLRLHIIGILLETFDKLIALKNELSTIISQQEAFVLVANGRLKQDDISNINKFSTIYRNRLNDFERYQQQLVEVIESVVKNEDMQVKQLNELLKRVYPLLIKIENEKAEQRTKVEKYNLLMSKLDIN
ncbi:hypothetical protein D3C71_1566790 [compost metagenome]